MGLNYSYILFFYREHVWDALHGIAQVSNPHQPPTKIIFPDHQLSIPLVSWSSNNNEMHHDDRKLVFEVVMYFPAEDEEILKYNREMWLAGASLSNPDDNQIAIGNINLYVYLNDRNFSSQEYVLFDFSAVSTTMSHLFENSPSIQKGFVNLLEGNNGVSGALDRELDGGRLFWFRDAVYNLDISDAYMTPLEIEELLNNRI